MNEIKFDFSKVKGKVKPMHAVNNGPVHKENDQARSNLKYFAEAGIPYARNHDASFCSSYGGPHIVDINEVFPNFDADPYLEESYDFTLTDIYSKTIEKSGAKVFYRLGSRIEHAVKKYGTLPPKDFKKWAIICEHIIKHFTEGWADGLHMDIEYWEIWNEPDLDPDDALNKRCWGGTEAQFLELYTIAATYLKETFPHLKIGGPALAHDIKWAERFLKHISNNNVPLDFFSWHIYCNKPEKFSEKAQMVRKLLDEYGYKDTESILNEWNYVKDWREGFVESIETIIGLKGAAFAAAVMCASQDESIDMLMYYDARRCAFNGLFDFYTLRPLKGYYTFKMFNELYKAGSQIECENNIADIYAIGAIDESKNGYTMITYYTDEENQPNKSISIKAEGMDYSKAEIYSLDDAHNYELVRTVDASNNMFEVEMDTNTVAMIKFIR